MVRLKTVLVWKLNKEKIMSMRQIVIERLTGFIQDADDYGVPAYFDCDEDDYIKDPSVLNDMTDEQLLEAFEACVGFQG